MPIRPALLLAFVRQALPVTLLAGATAIGFLLAWDEPIETGSNWPFLFILLHSLAVVQRVDSFHSGWFAFCRTRGFAQPQLVNHALLASFASVLIVWAVAAAIIWTGLRAEFQDHVIQSPYGPFLQRLERSLPLLWLGQYVVFIPVFHYALVRRAQPTRGMENGLLLAAAFGFAWGTLFLAYRHPVLSWVTWSVAGAYALTCLLGSLKLHRELEVRT